MMTDRCSINEAYSRIVYDCYPRSEALKRVRCSEYLSEYLKKKRIVSGMPKQYVVKDYFLKWLPYAVCVNDENLIECFYHAAEEYLRITAFLSGDLEYKNLDFLENSVRYESERLMHLKISIMKLTNSFIISKVPYIIELEKYKQKKAGDTCRDKHDSGGFIVQGHFSGNSVVLKKMKGGDYYIRLYFNSDVMNLVRDNDVLDINIIKNTESGKWKLDDINGCFLRSSVLI